MSSSCTASGTGDISSWRSIVTLIVFVLTNLAVLFPFDIPIYVPRAVANGFHDLCSGLRLIAPRDDRNAAIRAEKQGKKRSAWACVRFPVNFITAPLIADLFLLAILAIGRQEVYDGTVGTDGIVPLDIMAFFITLAYIAISVDASGLIRWLAFKVVQKGGKVGHRLFFYLYAFFFGLGSFIGNDPIILSGTAFLAYMTRVSSNIRHPRAWIHTQFAIANIASAILVSSNPTNLVLAGAFRIKFIVYTANMIVPVVVTAIVLFPFLLYVVFSDEAYIPLEIKIHELPDDLKAKKPINPNIPNTQTDPVEDEEKDKLRSLEEVMNPFLDRSGAIFGALLMAVTLITLLALNAATADKTPYPVFYVTVPAAFIMLCWDLFLGWLHRHETRDIARNGRNALEHAMAEKAVREEERRRKEEQAEAARAQERASLEVVSTVDDPPENSSGSEKGKVEEKTDEHGNPRPADVERASLSSTSSAVIIDEEDDHELRQRSRTQPMSPKTETVPGAKERHDTLAVPEEKHGFDRETSNDVSQTGEETDEEKQRISDLVSREIALRHDQRGPVTLSSIMSDTYLWAQETFPTTMAVFLHLPFPLVPFALAMFVLVQALVTKGWVPVFAYGWDHWVEKTGTIGAIGGMAFLSVILCNFAGTNIGTTILLSRVIQQWACLHDASGIPISDRTFWGTVYGMALGVNYGAFSTAFSASLAGLLWRDILMRKHIRVRRLEFARVNLPIIAIAMAVGSAVLIGEIYIIRKTTPYSL